jgi:hypothetical protein
MMGLARGFTGSTHVSCFQYRWKRYPFVATYCTLPGGFPFEHFRERERERERGRERELGPMLSVITELETTKTLFRDLSSSFLRTCFTLRTLTRLTLDSQSFDSDLST